jgi:hypothetical protein
VGWTRWKQQRPAAFRGTAAFFFLALQVDRPLQQGKMQRKRGNGRAARHQGRGRSKTQRRRDGQRGRPGGGTRARDGMAAGFDSLDSLDSLEAHRRRRQPPVRLDQESWPKHAKERHAPALCTSAVQRQVPRLGRHVQMTSRRGWQPWLGLLLVLVWFGLVSDAGCCEEDQEPFCCGQGGVCR